MHKILQGEIWDPINEEYTNLIEYLNKSHVTVLFTPGVDSYLTMKALRFGELNPKSIIYIYIDTKCKYSENEIWFLENITKNADREFLNYGSQLIIDHNSLDLSKSEDDITSFIPHRNAILAQIAHSKTYQTRKSHVMLFSGFLDDRIYDNNKEYMTYLTNLVNEGIGVKDNNNKVSITSLFWDYSKAYVSKQLANDWIENVFIKDLFHKTYSCYNLDKSKQLYTKIPIFEQDSNANFILKDISDFPGCLKCKACFRKVCLLAYFNWYIPMLDSDTRYLIKYDDNMPEERIKSIKFYKEFFNSYKDKGIYL